MQLSLRSRLIAGFLVAILTTATFSTLIGAWVIDERVAEQARDKARLDLNSARLVYEQRLSQMRDRMIIASLAPALRAAVTNGALGVEVARLRSEERLDFLTVTNATGQVQLRGERPEPAADSLADNPLVRRVLEGAPSAVATLVLDATELQGESPQLAQRARKGSPQDGRGLVVATAVPLLDESGRKRAILYGGRLINGDEQIVDEIRRTIYDGETFEGKEVGEGTLCLGGVRVATNLRHDNGERAVGTSVDPAVLQRVLVEGKPWIDLARVLDERHFAAYEPIRDYAGQPVGILSLGIPAEKFTTTRRETMLVFLGVSLAGLLVGVAIAVFLSRGVARPIGAVVAAVQDLARGNLDQRITETHSIHEIALLSHGFNAMAAALMERELQLKYRTEEQLGKAERLAMIGRLAAGVAHEINNPLGGIMLFANLLQKATPTDSPEHENLERICNEAKRCQRIVQGLLDFARKREPRLEAQNLHELVDKTLGLVSSQALFHDIATAKFYDQSCKAVRVDPSQTQQVLLNLIVNAAEAMGGRGTLTLATKPAEGGRAVQLEVSDTGRGISKENLEKLFEPFFTTKDAGFGTGLGLSISRGIVESHGGTIWAVSEEGKGTTFAVRWPAAEAA